MPRYHFTILRNCGEVIKRVFELAMRNDPEIRYCLALMLANLSGNLENHEFIATNVEMGRLSILVGCDDEETQGHAIATVSGLAISERNAKRIVESGLLIPQMSRECNSPHASVVVRPRLLVRRRGSSDGFAAVGGGGVPEPCTA